MLQLVEGRERGEEKISGGGGGKSLRGVSTDIPEILNRDEEIVRQMKLGMFLYGNWKIMSRNKWKKKAWYVLRKYLCPATDSCFFHFVMKPCFFWIGWYFIVKFTSNPFFSSFFIVTSWFLANHWQSWRRCWSIWMCCREFSGYCVLV